MIEHGDDLRTRLQNDKRVHVEKIKLGQEIEAIIHDGDASEESLAKDDKNALDLYRKHKMLVDISTVSLRPWQEEMFEKLKNPSDREVLWVCGVQGNEGKSFSKLTLSRCLATNALLDWIYEIVPAMYCTRSRNVH